MTPQALHLFAEWANLPPGSADALHAHGWVAHPLKDAGRTSAVGVVCGTEIHFAVAPEMRCRVIRRHRIADFLRPHFDRLGFLTTRVCDATPKEVSFLERLGFARVSRVGNIDHYMLTDLPFERNGI